MKDAPKGLRTHIALLGKRNAGKSSLLNAMANQEVAIVSQTPGTTTDPVEKTMELKPLGPVVLTDTAGIDDVGLLGEARMDKSRAIMKRADLAVVVTDGASWDATEQDLAVRLEKAQIPWLIARNKADLSSLPAAEEWKNQNGIDVKIPVADLSALKRQGIGELVDKLAKLAPEQQEKPLLADLLPVNGVVFFVAPIDTGAPKGRLILPQAQAIRDILDGRKICMVMTEEQLPVALRKTTPDLVVCDSQIVRKVAEETPESIPLTTFSILLARAKGDLAGFARGARVLKNLKPGDEVVMQEACSHHPQEDDIGRVKIPRLLQKLAGGELKFTMLAGKEIPDYPRSAKVIVHCGGCVITKANMRARQNYAEKMGIPTANYGMAISVAQGVIERVLQPFPEALAAYRQQA